MPISARTLQRQHGAPVATYRSDAGVIELYLHTPNEAREWLEGYADIFADLFGVFELVLAAFRNDPGDYPSKEHGYYLPVVLAGQVEVGLALVVPRRVSLGLLLEAINVIADVMGALVSAQSQLSLEQQVLQAYAYSHVRPVRFGHTLRPR